MTICAEWDFAVQSDVLHKVLGKMQISCNIFKICENPLVHGLVHNVGHRKYFETKQVTSVLVKGEKMDAT